MQIGIQRKKTYFLRLKGSILRQMAKKTTIVQTESPLSFKFLHVLNKAKRFPNLQTGSECN